MAKCRVLFHKSNGTVVGVLRKYEVELFDVQRGMENYHVVKMDEDELLDAFEYLDLGQYTPVYYDDLIVFPHEEFSIVEIADSRTEIFVKQTFPKSINRILTGIRMDDEEQALVKTALGTTLNIFGQIVDMEIYPEDYIHYRDYLINIMKEFDVKEDYK